MSQVIFVTGGAGYIGSHAAKALFASGYKPVVIDNLSRGLESAVKWGALAKVDIGDTDSLVELFGKYQPAAVMHFAAFAYVGESMVDPYLYYENNVSGTLGLLSAMRHTGCDKLIFSSTCATYGIPDGEEITEETPQNPVNPYGMSKLMIERILSDADVAYGLKSICLRYFNAAGSDPECEIGECHEPETHLIPLALRAAAQGEFELKVFGADYDTPDGSCIRDYIHVSDLADAHVLALESLLQGGDSDCYNLGLGKGFSVLDVINEVQAVTGLDVRFSKEGRRAGDPPSLVSCADKARQKLRWSPKYLDLKDQIQHSWNWAKKAN